MPAGGALKRRAGARRRVARVVAALLVAAATALAAGRAEGAPDANAVARATAGLDAEEWVDRVSAVYALQRFGSDAAPAAPRLAALLDDENGLVRFESAEALKRIGAPAVPPLLAALASGKDEVRRLAATTLGRIGLGARDASAALRAAAETDPAPDVREAAALAAAMVAPEGAAGWVRKLAFEVQDEPEGPIWLLGAFVVLSLLTAAWRAVRARRRAAEEAAAASDADEDPGGKAGHGEDDDEEHGDEDDDELAVVAARCGPSGARTRDEGPPPPQGPPHTVAGLVVVLLGVLVALLGGRSEDVEERRVAYLGGSLVVLLGWGFLRLGVAGWWTQRTARRRAARAAEPWLRDRDWSREGARPIEAERVLPNLVSLVLVVAWLAPFHTAWRVSFAWWGFWLVLAVFDLLVLVMLHATLVRVWRALSAGRCFLRWQGAPVRPGGTFAARFETARSLGGAGRIEATLRCLRDRAESRRIGDEPAADAEEVYAETKELRLHARPDGGSWAQVSFAVPEDARGTRSHAWRPVRCVLRVRVPTAGPDFETSFPVPIYR